MRPSPVVLLGLVPITIAQNGPVPIGPVAPDTAGDCTFWDTCADASQNCGYFEDTWFLPHTSFFNWNPSVKEDCSGIKVGNSYCIEVNNGQPRPITTKKGDTPRTTTTRKISTTTSQAPVDTCNPGAPEPVQPGAIRGCNKWHQVKDETTTCDGIISYNKISPNDFFKWNPDIGRACTTLWKGYNVCVGVPGSKPNPTTTSKSPAETCNPGAPQPVQPGVVCGCNKWHLVLDETTTCDGIIKYDKISANDFYKWNPTISKDCTGLWKGYNVCVGVPGSKPNPTTTIKPPVETCNPDAPQPVQPGVVCRCNKWHLVLDETTTCDGIIKYDKISANDFYKWNPNVGRDCKGLWKGYNVCVGMPGSKPTSGPPKPIETCNPGAPQPIQPGTVCHCKKWHIVKNEDTTCAAIISYNKISADNFYKWNPAVGRDCKGLWLRYNVCVGV